MIPLPPLEKQKRIAGILDEADRVRKKTQALIDKYDELAQSLFLDMFGDPVTNPKGWEVKRLGVLCSKIGSGSTPRGGAESYQDSGTTLIRSLNVYNDGFREKGLAFIDEHQASKLNHVTVHENDVLFNITGASVCRTCVVPSRLLPARVNQHVAILRAKSDQVVPVFLHSLLTSENSQRVLNAIGEQGGATRQAITKAQLNSLEVIVPPIQEQNDFASRLNEIESGKSSLLSSLASGETTFNSLLQKAFKGELT